MRRWGFLIVAVLYVALGVTLLFDSFRPLDTGENDAERRKVTLTFRHFWISEHDLPVAQIVQDAVTQFEEKYRHVKVKLEGLDQTIHREQKLKSEMVSGTQPELFALFGGAEIEPYVQANRLLDLTDFLKKSGLNKRFKDLELWTFDGRVYGLPIEGNAEPLFYNRAIFEQLGLVPPQTIEELPLLIEQLRKAGYTPFALGNTERWQAAIFTHYLMDRLAPTDLFAAVREGQASFDHPAYVEAFTWLERLAEAGAFPERVNELVGDEAIRLFTSGQAAMYLNGSWDINLFQNEAAPPQFANDVGVIPFPAAAVGQEQALAGGYTFGLGVSADLRADEQEAALLLLEELFTDKVQVRLAHEAMRIPAVDVAIQASRTGPIFAATASMTEPPTKMFIPYDNMLSPEVKMSFLRVTAQVIDGQLTAVEAVRQLDEASQRYWSLRARNAAE